MKDMNREELVAEAIALRNNEKGEFTPEAATKAVELRNAIEAIDSKENTEVVDTVSADTEVLENRADTTFNIQTNNKMDNNFSLGGVLRTITDGKQVDGFAKEAMEESRNRAANSGINTSGDITFDPSVIAEMRAAGDFQADSAVSGEAGGATIGLDIAAAQHTLRPISVFDKLNVTRLTGLRGDLNLPTGVASVAGTATEIATANKSASSFAANTLTPQRVAAMLNVSGQLMKQSDANIEAFLMGDLMKAVGQAQDEYFIAALFGAITETDATGVAFADVLANMEADLYTAGASVENAQVLMAPSVAKGFRTAPMVTNVNAIADAKGVIGYDNVISSLAADSTDGDFVCLGDFSDFVIGEWGGIDMKVDQYTLAAEDQIRLIVNTHVDATPRQTGNYSIQYNVGL